MYYHTQELKYVTYDKIYPAPLEVIDKDFLKPYQWLGKYCGYCPQIWLSRSRLGITGYKCKSKQKKSQFFGVRRNFEPNVLFAFDVIKGFPVSFDIWEFILNPLMCCKDPVKEGDNAIKEDLKELLHDFKTHPYEPYNGKIDLLPHDDILWQWSHSNNYEDFLNKYLFVEHDQVVVPSLNLKTAKEVFCRNEKQVKSLRRMGFIEDRIKILNSKQWN
jgi:hypothetical protein